MTKLSSKGGGKGKNPNSLANLKGVKKQQSETKDSK
jgi:hypothetical protein